MIVTDPDGIDDVIGGALKSQTGQTFGAFQTAASEGSYEMSLIWDEINTVEAIAPLSTTGKDRVFIAEFYDQAGHVNRAELVIQLGCESGLGSVCDADGSCINLQTNDDHCGACGSQTGDSEYCKEGEIACSSGNDRECVGWYASELNIDIDLYCPSFCKADLVLSDLSRTCYEQCEAVDSFCTKAVGTYTNQDVRGDCGWIWALSGRHGQLSEVLCECSL